MAYLGYSQNLFCIQTKVYSLYKPARWSHIFIHIVQKPRESSHSIIHPKLATQYSNVHLLFLSSYIKLKSNYIVPHTSVNLDVHPLFLFSSLSLSLSLFPLLPIFVPPYSYYYVSIEGSHAIKLCLLCQPSCLMFSISYFIRHYILLKCVKFAMFCLLYICNRAKEKENQTEINKSNVAQNISVHGQLTNQHRVIDCPRHTRHSQQTTPILDLVSPIACTHFWSDTIHNVHCNTHSQHTMAISFLWWLAHFIKFLLKLLVKSHL